MRPSTDPSDDPVTTRLLSDDPDGTGAIPSAVITRPTAALLRPVRLAERACR